MFSSLNQFVALISNQKPLIYFKDFQNYSHVGKQQILLKATKQAKFNPHFNIYNSQCNSIIRPELADIRLYNGVTIHCGVKKYNNSLYLNFCGKKHILQNYKSKLDNTKLKYLKDSNVVVETRFIQYRFLDDDLEIMYFLMPGSDVYTILFDTITQIR